MIDLKRIAKRWILPITGSAAAMATIFYLYRDLDFGRFIGGLQDANRWWIAMLAATILLEQLVNGWKWRQVLYDLKPVSSLRLTGAMLAGYGANVLVPLGISPLVRAWLIARLEALQMGTVLTTTIIARFIDGVVFALFAGVVAVAGKVPQVDGNLEKGLSVAGALNLVLFSGLLWMMFRFRTVFAGFSMVISKFVRVPGGFVIGSAFAFHLLGVPDEQALLMVLFNFVMSILLVVVIGLVILWCKRRSNTRPR